MMTEFLRDLVQKRVWVWDFLEEVYRPVLQILTLFQTKKMSFFTPVFRPDLQNPYPLLDLASKKLCHHYLDWNTKTNDFLIRTFLFLSYSFGIEKINTFKHSRCNLENHTRFQTKICKVYVIVPVFRPKQSKNPILFFRAAHTYRAYIREYPPLPPPPPPPPPPPYLDNPFLT